MSGTLTIDDQTIPFTDGQTIIEAARTAGVYIPHLCHRPGYTPHGSCKLCTVKVNGRTCSACTFPAAEGQKVVNNSEELQEARLRITQMLFVEGNHFCPTCEKSGNCELQAVGYHLNMLDSHFPHFYAHRKVDASHPDILIDHNRCIFCNLCVRASRESDGKDVFGIAGRGIQKRLIINSPTGQLKDSNISVEDSAVQVCPTGAILVKRTGYKTPIGGRIYDQHPISTIACKKRETDSTG
ncbi:MAG: 2Fe-2S iron-sulfur cluster-binding protein [Methylicorpusculum sp.]|uniref:2Fe-2S iron-sulfur cluster-binding protein n=1 Tax=Methylicorpusculum sp. TaxID=2713644 RepID=UPI0027266D75|nr:2Fe-2S iron-sulfur cluster-binding protein [Methylicorpusculum sp.]MDO8939378.1 2Fe-2S iron-sulfur cluster-binding protein [Methylicorpusculum sp.]MDP2177423.1 2Fe-2S iron-sulfur cluster-binding protein [Methylicorpusculum sp.]MDP2201517.1 2Fe-2S iron-sulfur cluster-binding protein [Methylicorpusculum sp.]MDP3530179.1 2Fe-2S iron-sulfur cluster-binding protein [Methylicorpusculum sp.]MDZ4154769.1 2Fe-2S iron-sulfur cluster-binding protein [Methylicorpusculum sp.]